MLPLTEVSSQQVQPYPHRCMLRWKTEDKSQDRISKCSVEGIDQCVREDAIKEQHGAHWVPMSV